MKINQSELKKVLRYRSETGVFRWNISKVGVRRNSVAGCIKAGYMVFTRIMDDDRRY